MRFLKYALSFFDVLKRNWKRRGKSEWKVEGTGLSKNHSQRFCASSSNGKLTFLPRNSRKTSEKGYKCGINHPKLVGIANDNATCHTVNSIKEVFDC